jgi:diguanylate cyclase (GGDEF)-like protein
MGQLWSDRVLDVSDVRFRVRTIAAGVWITFATLVPCAAYLLATLDRPHRGLIAILVAVGLAGALGVYLLPGERIVRSRRREWFFLAWSMLDIALLAVLIAADGGGRSPMALIFFIPMVFGALSYPLRSVALIGFTEVVAYMCVSLVVGGTSLTYLLLFSSILALTAAMCIWQARNHDHQREELARVSRSDPLTGCLNRRGFEERIEAELADAWREGRGLSLVVLDLDGFKSTNDTHGHAAGDELLRFVVSTLATVLRPSDAIGRLGGDEFAVLLPGARSAKAGELLTRMAEALAPRVSASFGRASFPFDGADAEALFRYADAELYAAKRGAPRQGGASDLSWAATLAWTVDARMDLEHEHSGSVARYAAAIAVRLGWPAAAVDRLRIAAMLHDVGKIGVPEGILRKPARLTDEEFEIVKRHPEIGADLVSGIEGLADVAQWIRNSHESFDGSGYPDGLAGEAIPEASRIMLVADAFDAMTSDRPYRNAMPLADVVSELRRASGSQFDPRAVDALIAAIEAEAAAVAEEAA